MRTFCGDLRALFVEDGVELPVDVCSGCGVAVDVSNSGSGLVIFWCLFVLEDGLCRTGSLVGMVRHWVSNAGGDGEGVEV